MQRRRDSLTTLAVMLVTVMSILPSYGTDKEKDVAKKPAVGDKAADFELATVDGKAERRPTPFYERDLLRAGDRLKGPAIIEQYDSTTVVPPGSRLHVDNLGNLVMTLDGGTKG